MKLPKIKILPNLHGGLKKEDWTASNTVIEFLKTALNSKEFIRSYEKIALK